MSQSAQLEQNAPQPPSSAGASGKGGEVKTDS